jgi:alpha-beta hydrolase superfamily lysophospholipase
MHALHDRSPGAAGNLLVMLPPAKACAQDLVDRGFVAAIRERGLPLDIAVMDADADYYLEGRVGERLAADVIAPMRARGYARIWLMGISLGGFGCISLARRRAAELEGVILLAPFLGSRGPEALEPADAAWFPAAYLGFGASDRYAAASETLARRLPEERVVRIPGEHDWQTWMRLWRTLLAKPLFPGQA